MKQYVLSALLVGMGWSSSLCGGHELDRDALVSTLETIRDEYAKLGQEIEQLKRLLGKDDGMEKLSMIELSEEAADAVTIYTEEGVRLYKAGDLQGAKEALQKAYEQAPNLMEANYNLGLLYYKMGNRAMAKKLLKTVLEGEKELPGRKAMADYVEGKREEPAVKELARVDPRAKNELLNLRKEAESYLRARELTLPAKKKATVGVLEKMHALTTDSKELQKEFLLSLGESFADFEMYQRALDVFKEYETAMEGEVLPDEYFTQLLQVEEKAKHLHGELQAYLGNDADKEIRRKLHRDLKELSIFAVQIDEFVEELSREDSDFVTISQRLGEYKWGKRPNRHVMIADRFGELIHSSLDGTLPLDRYQDMQGRKFLQQITQLSEEMELKQAEFVEVDLNVNGRPVPYVVMYTYIPHHEAFIIVRLPRDELQG